MCARRRGARCSIPLEHPCFAFHVELSNYGVQNSHEQHDSDLINSRLHHMCWWSPSKIIMEPKNSYCLVIGSGHDITGQHITHLFVVLLV